MARVIKTLAMLDPNISCDRCGTPLSLSSMKCPGCRAFSIGFLKSLNQGLRKRSAGGVIFLVIVAVLAALFYAWNDAST
jgi:hypothetical protein